MAVGDEIRLSFTDGALAQCIVDVTVDYFTIGRAEGNDLRVPGDGRTSPHHAEIVRRNGGWVIRDRDSAGGVWLDDERIDGEAWLCDGMTLRIGGQRAIVGVRRPLRLVTLGAPLGPAALRPMAPPSIAAAPAGHAPLGPAPVAPPSPILRRVAPIASVTPIRQGGPVEPTVAGPSLRPVPLRRARRRRVRRLTVVATLMVLVAAGLAIAAALGVFG